MPEKTDGKEKAAKPTLASVSKQLSEITGAVSSLAETVKMVNDRVNVLETPVNNATATPAEQRPAQPVGTLNAPSGTNMEWTKGSGLKNGDGSDMRPTFTDISIESKLEDIPVPGDYVLVKNQIFGPIADSIGIVMKGFSDKPMFQFSLVIPREYSDMTEEEWQMKKTDLRTLNIPYTMGVNGVTEWCRLVYQNIARRHRIAPISPRIPTN